MRHELEYIVVQDMAQLGHPITWVCQALSISRSAYYHWLHRTPSARERENRHILDEMRHLYQAYRGIYGYRRLADEYNAIHHTNYNEKRFHRLAKIGNLRAIIRTKQPAPHAAPLMQLPANILARDFVAQAPQRKMAHRRYRARIRFRSETLSFSHPRSQSQRHCRLQHQPLQQQQPRLYHL